MNQSQHYQRIEAAIHWMLAHYREQPDLAQIAAVVNLSPGHFQREFQAWAGVSPKRYLQFLTLEYAKQKIHQTDLLYLAEDAGLSSPGRLHDLFVNIEAMSPGEYRAGKGLRLGYGQGISPLGRVNLIQSQRGLSVLEFDQGEGLEAFQARWQLQWPKAEWQASEMQSLIDQVFAIKPKPQLQLHLYGSNFQLQVWRALLKLPFGELQSYSQVAQQLEQPLAVRAVASAIAKNPVAWLIPCHRVLRQSGELGGYRWGLEQKQCALAWEAGIRAVSGSQ